MGTLQTIGIIALTFIAFVGVFTWGFNKGTDYMAKRIVPVCFDTFFDYICKCGKFNEEEIVKAMETVIKNAGELYDKTFCKYLNKEENANNGTKA